MQFKKGTTFKFREIDFLECFWDSSPLYKEMLRSGNSYIIDDCWVDDETGHPRFKFSEVNLMNSHYWEIGGILAYVGVIINCLTKE